MYWRITTNFIIITFYLRLLQLNKNLYTKYFLTDFLHLLLILEILFYQKPLLSIVYNIYIYFLLLSWIMIPCLNWTNMTKKRHQYCLILSIGHFRESFLPPWHVTLQLCSCVISHLTWITKTRGGYILYICSKSINTL